MMTISKHNCPSTMFPISDDYYAGAVSPVITLQPVTDSFGVRSNVTLICEASGFPAPAYTWLFNNGTEIPGANQSEFGFVLEPQRRGSYSCVATNSRGSATSQVAFITINGEMVIVHIHVLSPCSQKVKP